MINLVPIEDHIIVEPLENETKTSTGILLPDSSKEKPGKGKVIAVGPGKILDNGQRSSMDVKFGDLVYFTKYSPDEIEMSEEGKTKKYLVIRHSSILAKESA